AAEDAAAARRRGARGAGPFAAGRFPGPGRPASQAADREGDAARGARGGAERGAGGGRVTRRFCGWRRAVEFWWRLDAGRRSETLAGAGPAPSPPPPNPNTVRLRA